MSPRFTPPRLLSPSNWVEHVQVVAVLQNIVGFHLNAANGRRNDAVLNFKLLHNSLNRCALRQGESRFASSLARQVVT
jgi:hypothetical protein